MTRARIPYGSAERALNQTEAQIERLAASGLLASEASEEFPDIRVLADSATIEWDFATDGAASASVPAGTYQPLDATLTALAGAPTAADKLPYFTGTDTVGTTTFTTFARTILDDADAPTVRATISAAGFVATRNVHTNVTQVASTATSLEETLMSYTLPGGTLSVNKDRCEIDAWGDAAGTATTKRLRLYFGATVLFDSGVLVLTGTSWRIQAKVFRSGAATQVAIGFFAGDTALVTVTALSSSPTQPLSSDVLIKLTSTVGVGVAAGDVLQNGLEVGIGTSA